jgi:uncharacterized protein
LNSLIHLTHDCNLRCPYCFTGAKWSKEMDVETGKKAADFTIDHAATRGEAAVISFFGGEPMLCFDVMKEIVLHAEAEAKRRGVTVLFRMNTNGTLITDEHLAFFDEHDLIFILSVDGNQDMHDLERRTAGDKGSFAQIAERFPAFLEHNPALMISVVVTPTNVVHFADGLAYLLDTGFRYFIVKPDVTQAWSKDDIAELDRQYARAGEDYLGRARRGEECYVNLFDDKWLAHTRGTEAMGIRCDVGTSQISIAPSGNIYPCVRWVKEEIDTVPRLGHVSTGFDPVALARVQAESHAPKSPCNTCSYNDGRCANECACEHYSATGRIDTPAPALCEHERVIVPIADRVGTTLWRERNPIFLRKQYATTTVPPSEEIES